MSAKIFSFFSGIGLLDLGFEHAGFSTAFVNEAYKPFLSGYVHARDGLGIQVPEQGYYQGSLEDLLTGTEAEEFRRRLQAARGSAGVLGFVGGPPCPDFSVGGKNRGHAGDHGRLSGVFVSLIEKYQPDFFLFENVKGLWQTRRHRAFYETLRARLHAAGYLTSQRLINALHYGVPQDRERIILIGLREPLVPTHAVNRPRPMGPHFAFPWLARAASEGLRAKAFSWPTRSPFVENSALPAPAGLPLELTAEAWFQRNKVWCHPNTGHCFRPRAGLKRFQAVDEGDDSRKSFKRLHRWRYSPTACYGNNEVHLHPYHARRLSVAEVLALQSAPLDYSLPNSMTLSQMFKSVGNAVPYRAALELARTLMDVITGVDAWNTHDRRMVELTGSDDRSLESAEAALGLELALPDHKYAPA